MTVAFVQPFSVQAPGGGPRILRAMLEGRPHDVISVCTSAGAPPAADIVRELHVPPRPTFGRLESTRLHRQLGVAGLALERRFERQLRQALVAERVRCVHLIPHDASFWPAFRAARDLGLPVILSVHDHLAYAMQGRPEAKLAMRRLGTAWRAARERWMISDALGAEYERLYGAAGFGIVTDGLEEVHPPRAQVPGRCTVYFMGAFHESYRPNLEVLIRGLEMLARRRSDLAVKLKLRCGALSGLPRTDLEVELLPFAPEHEIARDMDDADVLWLPLPHGEEHADFVRFSMSTKLVTYLGSGLPILYQGPADAAAATLLRDADAGVEAVTARPEDVADAVLRAAEHRVQLAEAAARLAREQFMLDDLRARFWASLVEPAPVRH
jgi:glycosyltransferase involved in cell wall biosynthesis